MSDGQPSFADRALAAMLELLHEGALLFEGDALTCRFASARAADILGVPAGSLTGRTRDDLLASVTPADEATARALAALRASQPGERRRETVALQGRPRPRPRVEHRPARPGRPFRGRIDILADRTVEALLRVELDRAYARMAQTSILDDLTGLSNRKHFESEVDREHRRSQRSWASYAVARIDVDGMAQLNADIGEEAGDTLLRRTGEVLARPRAANMISSRAGRTTSSSSCSPASTSAP
ncbi:MAG: diguanylate cyclase [Polyangiaceae bacterium]